jgi:nucleoside-diphosphate-sugar epimerase
MNAVRVLVTGATGFVGRVVCRHLAAVGHQVHALHRVEGRPRRIDDSVHAWHACASTDASVRAVVRDAAPDVIVHLAAYAVGPAGDGEVTRLVEANLLLGARVLAAAAEAGCRHLVTTGTYWEYLDGHEAVSLYAALKQAFALVVRYHGHAHGLRAVTLALYDIYGPDDPRGKFIDQLVASAHAGTTLEASDGQQAIDLVHVEDVARAYVTAVGRVRTLEAGTHEPFGVGSGRSWTLREIAAVVERSLGTPVTVHWGARTRAPRTFDRPPVLPRLPGWAPLVTLEDGVATLLARGADA